MTTTNAKKRPRDLADLLRDPKAMKMLIEDFGQPREMPPEEDLERETEAMNAHWRLVLGRDD